MKNLNLDQPDNGIALLPPQAAPNEQTSGDQPVARPTPGPSYVKYARFYLDWQTKTGAKSPLTIKKEASALHRWMVYFATKQMDQITLAGIRDFALTRVNAGVSNRTVNLDVIALHNLLKFAQSEGVITKLPTAGWKPLRYVAPRRSLITNLQLRMIYEEALSQKWGFTRDHPRYENGQLLKDLIRFIAFSGARREAALSARWENVDWTNRQITLFTKFDKKVVVDFNHRLEAQLFDMQTRSIKDNPWIFPSPQDPTKHLNNPQRLIDKVAARCKIPSFKLHDLRHYFISYCVMSGVDTLTIATWVGHSDGGVLIGKVYGHLNPQHRRKCAQQVQFA